MWFSEALRFPYPVLTTSSDDYLSGSFEVHLGDVEENMKSGQVDIAYKAILTESSILGFVENGQARIGLIINCNATYYSSLYEIGLGGGSLSISGGELKDRVDIRPIIYSIDDACSSPFESTHEEFGCKNWEFEQGQFLALGESHYIYVGLDKLAPMETIFSFAKDDSIPEGEIRLQLDSEVISIVLNGNTFRKIHGYRKSSMAGMNIVMNSVYLPAVMEILSALKDGSEGLEERRWFGVFSAKCAHLGINVADSEILPDAQKLLKLPLKRLTETVEF